MPGFNQKGPFGQGAMTGRQMGRCTNFGKKIQQENASVDVNSENEKNLNLDESRFYCNRMNRFGIGRGFGGGRGRGFRHGF